MGGGVGGWVDCLPSTAMSRPLHEVHMKGDADSISQNVRAPVNAPIDVTSHIGSCDSAQRYVQGKLHTILRHPYSNYSAGQGRHCRLCGGNFLELAYPKKSSTKLSESFVEIAKVCEKDGALLKQYTRQTNSPFCSIRHQNGGEPIASAWSHRGRGS